MAWNYGFYNSVNGDRVYNANDINSFFEGILTDGVYEGVGNKLEVKPLRNMLIQIDNGRGWFSNHWVNNDESYILTLEPSDVLLNRYCAVCIKVDDNESVRSAEPYLKYSEFATNPVKPTMVRTPLVNEYCLAYIYIKANATAITANDIEDTRDNANLCGWVSSRIEQIGSVNFPTSLTITLSAGSWVNKRQNVRVESMTTSRSVIVQSNDNTKVAYANAGIKCSDQSTNSLTFTCDTVPTTDIKVDILYMGK